MLHLRELRQQKHLTQKELSKILQISASTIGMYEQGRREPDHDTLTKIADFFGVPTDYLLGRIAPASNGSWEYAGNYKGGFAGQDGVHFALFAGQQEEEQKQEPRYYHDPEVAEMANQLKDNPDMRVLFDASRDLKKESIEEVVKFIQYQKAKERGEF
jgi:transcriptional regulator with XRE-family HTH domain